MQTATVIFNGKEIIVPAEPLFYRGVVSYALNRLSPEEHIYTVVYVGPYNENGSRLTGSLWPHGPSVWPEDGMQFEVVDTSRA